MSRTMCGSCFFIVGFHESVGFCFMDVLEQQFFYLHA